MRRLHMLTYRHRVHTANWTLGLFLAFNAGAINAGGFLVLHAYTSHMTGLASQLADSSVLGNRSLFLNALGAIIAFISGAAVCAVLVSWARQTRLRSVYALPLFLEAALMFPFGFMGTVSLTWSTPFAMSVTALLLSFIMGLQNAVGSKTSRGSIRTTHMTGNITDFGMGLGKLACRNARSARSTNIVQYEQTRMRRSAGLIVTFFVGGIVGALGFKYVGFICVVPLAFVLLVLSVPPLVNEARTLPAVRRAFKRLR